MPYYTNIFHVFKLFIFPINYIYGSNGEKRTENGEKNGLERGQNHEMLNKTNINTHILLKLFFSVCAMKRNLPLWGKDFKI